MLSVCRVSDGFCFVKQRLTQEIEIRGDHLSRAGEEAIIGIGHLFVGVGNGLFSFTPIGFRERVLEDSRYNLTEAGKIFAKPYEHFLLALNPNAKISPSLVSDSWGKCVENFRDKAEDLSLDKNFLKRYLASRVIYTIHLIGLAAIRAVQAVVGCFGAIFSLCLFGLSPSLNRIAYDGLKFPLIILDCFYCGVKWISPRTNLLFVDF
jgi:uncharacterized membrane protein YiaA